MGDLRKLGLEDISDLRAYERERPDLQKRVSEVKRLRRIALGPIMSVVFENALTVRYQIQEMARVEKILSDEAIQVELDTYNRLLPQMGELSATLFIELTSDEQLREWLPKLVGIERALGVALDGDFVPSVPEEAHAAALVRDTVTPAVHYVRFAFSLDQVEAFAGLSEVALEARHPEYEARTPLPVAVRRELLGDLRGTTKPLPIG